MRCWCTSRRTTCSTERKPRHTSRRIAPNPLNVYGRSKLAGEEAVRAADGRHLILRTSWVYSLRGRNFLRTMVRLGLTSDLVRVIDDQTGAPTSSRELALACLGMSWYFQSSDIGSGLYHITSTGSCSWFEFACAIRNGLIARGVPWRAVLERCSTLARGELGRSDRRTHAFPPPGFTPRSGSISPHGRMGWTGSSIRAATGWR